MDITDNSLDLVFVDDSIGLTTAWEMAAELKGKNIKTFNTIEKFLAFVPQCSKITPIYIDYDLKASITGIDLAKQLHEQGFKTLYLATGYNPSQFSKDKYPWIKEVVIKEAPF